MTESPRVLGPVVDDQTRCVHYASDLDVIAIKHRCCREYYPCHRCHAETADHPVERWRPDELDERAVLCGVCRHELRIDEYLTILSCPSCDAAFNEGCRLHTHLYFRTT